MSTKTKPAKREPDYGPHAEWKSALVLWGTRNGVRHVVTRAALVGRGVVSKVACGGATSFWIESGTWYGQKGRGHKFCRKCVAWLEARKK